MNFFNIQIILVINFLLFENSLEFGFNLFELIMRKNMTNMMNTTTSNKEEKMTKKTKCLNPPRTAKKVEMNIKNCQEEVKNKILKEAFEILRDHFEYEHEIEEHSDDFHKEQHHITDHLHDEEFDGPLPPPQFPFEENHHEINKRSFSYHPTLVPNEDKRIAGCLLHCVYAKNNAIDKLGWPTLDGLVDFYSEGVNEHGFFMATLRAVNLCLKAATYKYHVNRHKLPEKGESCDLAFEVFDCISDQITSYCLDHYNHE